MLSRLLNPADLAVNMVGAIVIQMTLFYLMALMLPPRSKRAYYGTALVCIAVIMFFKPVLSPFVRVAIAAALMWGLAILMLRGPLVMRLVIPGVGILAETAGETVGMLFWVGITGLGKVDNAVLLQHLPVYLLGFSLGSVGTMVLIMLAVRAVAKKLGLIPVEPDGKPADDRRPWQLRYAWFVIVQLLLMSVVTIIGLDYLDWGGGSAVVAAVLFAFCFLADAALFAQIERAVDHEAHRVRSRMLEAQVEEYLSDAARLQELLDDTARLRHDLRNHRMVVEALCERGEYGRAETYLEEMLRRVPGS